MFLIIFGIQDSKVHADQITYCMFGISHDIPFLKVVMVHLELKVWTCWGTTVCSIGLPTSFRRQVTGQRERRAKAARARAGSSGHTGYAAGGSGYI